MQPYQLGISILGILDLTVHQYWHEFLGRDLGVAVRGPFFLFLPLPVAVSSPIVLRVKPFQLLQPSFEI